MTRLVVRRSRDLPNPDGVVAEVGFPIGTTPDILDRAIYNHFGTQTIPERPFLDIAADANARKVQGHLRDGAKAILDGRLSEDTVVRRIAEGFKGDVQDAITDLRTPPNAPSTVAQKRSSNPLIDTGQMRASVTYRVRRP